MEEILLVYVKIEQVISVDGHNGKACMVCFSGYSKSPYFNGTILSNAVDCQKFARDSQPTLSARYILEGIDGLGLPCKIFIENNGETDISGNTYTHPLIYTDSDYLKFLETTPLIGTISNDGEFVVIHICKK